MACRIADNKPLAQLSRELAIPPRCHGKRRECIQGFQTHGDEFVMGAAGAAIGYCQALFANAGDARQHTEKVQRLLREIEAPWCESHELQWAYRLNATATDFVSSACAPLLGCGRVPILITALDPARQAEELEAILATSPAVPDSESILVRVVLNSTESAKAMAAILRTLLSNARAERRMPRWWPLLQGTMPVSRLEVAQTPVGHRLGLRQRGSESICSGGRVCRGRKPSNSRADCRREIRGRSFRRKG